MIDSLGAMMSATITAIGSLLLGFLAWKLVDLAAHLYVRRHPAGHLPRQDRSSVIPLARLGLRILLVLGVATTLVSSFVANISLPLAVVGVVTIAVTVAAQDTLADVVDGALILLDRPFRVGDRIQIQELQTWGDVMSIGVRTTRIRTLDNRLVIVPNSRIGRGQVVNYSYPDDTYRLEVNFGVAYGTDVEVVRGLIIDAVAEVEMILPHRPIDALVDALEDSAIRFRVRCWIDSYVDYRKARDRVQTHLYRALQVAGIESPITTASVRLESGVTDG